MTRRRKSRIRRIYTKARRHIKSKPSLYSTLGLIGGTIASLNDRNSIAQSAITHLPNRNFTDFGADLIVQTIGYDPRDQRWRIPTVPVMLIATAMLKKGVNKIAKGSMKGLPIGV